MTSEESVSSIVLGAASSLTFDGVEYTAGSSGIALGTATESGTEATLVVNDSTISVKGVYAISTDATVKESVLLTENVTIMISGSEITADEATVGNSCAVMVNIPLTLTITDSTITGDRQGLAVQGGDASITRSKIISTGEYKGGEYYTDGTWGSGSEAPFAALLAGNRNSDEIRTNVTCILEDATIEMESTHANAYDIYVYRSGAEENIEVSVGGSVTNSRDDLKVNDETSSSMNGADFIRVGGETRSHRNGGFNTPVLAPGKPEA